MKTVCCRLKCNRNKLKWFLVFNCLLSTLSISFQVYHSFLSGYVRDSVSSIEELRICIVGNAQTKEHALAIHRMWKNKFDSFWFIWNSSTTKQFKHLNNINYFYSKDHLSWTRGIELLIDHLLETKKQCDYIFTHDDDLKFHIKKKFRVRKAPLPDLLIDALKTYRPAIASFPWSFADKTISAMQELESLYEIESIAPLTGFDNGMVIYHKSIIDFFIPFSPRGEGGFSGEWTLCAHFLQMFAHLVFGKYAIRLNMFEYNHSININNLLLQNNSVKRMTRIENGLAYIPHSRHPYEYPQNEAYKKFLSDGLKLPFQSWGRTLTKEYRLETLKATDPKRNSFDGLWLLKRLNEVYDIRHEALSNNKLLQEQCTNQQKLKVLQETNFTLKLILLTMNRPQSFERLWKSIANALPISRIIDIFIHVDMDNDNNERVKYLEYLNSLRSLHGNVHVIAYATRRSLKTIMKEAWYPLSNDEYAIFLEDDIEVSPYFLLYVEKMVKAYFYNLKLDKRLFGISLYNQHYNEVEEKYVTVTNGYQPYVYQMPQSWGALYAPKMWRHFVKFLKNQSDPVIPNSYTNRWPKEKSWKKYLLRFMYHEQSCLIYPNFQHNFSLSTNHLEYGMNNKLSRTTDEAQLRKNFTVRLLYDERIFKEMKTPPFESLQIYNVHHKRVNSLDDLKIPATKLTAFDTCTMILSVYDRTNSTLDRLVYYQNFTYLSAIIVIWNNVHVQPIPKNQLNKFRIPIHILRMKKNSLNNRFYPHKEILTDCIINMDDDWDMPYSHMAFAIDTWRGHFFHNLVGYSHLGRNHVPKYNKGTLHYVYSNILLTSKQRPFYSIVLPSGFVYHRRYLYEYTYKLPQTARDLVDSLNNCDDILFNFLIANITKQGPVVIDARAKPYDVDGLWKRPNHMESRTLCLNKFVEIFHGMPLKYTTSLFKIDRNQTVPGKNKHLFQAQMPTPTE